jgi:hypothetical protein
MVGGEPVRRIVEHCRRLGCTCDPPDVRFMAGSPPRYGEVSEISVAHEDGCPLLGAESAIITLEPE